MRSWLKRLRRRITYSERFKNLAAGLAALVIVLYAKTLRVQWCRHPEFLKLDINKLIYGFWHGRQFLLVPNFGRWHVVLMTDVSWAGDVQTRILSRLGYIIVRGSSKRKGAQALLNMKRAIEGGFSGGIALDGPRGPIYESKPGILFLARKVNYPVVPLTTSADRCWVFKNTWCRYLLPKPFSRCCIAIGKPIWQTDGEAVATEVLDRRVMELTAEADLKVGRSPDNS